MFIVNGIGDDGATMISDVLKRNTTVKKLGLKGKWTLLNNIENDCLIV